jgi:GTPase SAR1 family protein
MQAIQNPQLQLAHDFVQFTGNNIFLTGKAGTGKTTFLHQLKEISPKRMVVVAPTGVAAINAGGVTIHSFFQLSFGPQVPGFTQNTSQTSFKKFSKEKKDIMKSLDLLIIDEISMVRADVLDGIDATLRRFKNRNKPFGGVQLLMIGDLQQLAPVVKEAEWSLLREHYETAFFFSSLALKQTDFISIELKHVYRQSDEKFISLLNKIRDNKMDQGVIDSLNKRYDPGFKTDQEGYIILTTHNAKADEINNKNLKKIKRKSWDFFAEIDGNFPEYNYPTKEDLELKVGAQVMFIKNDPNPEKLFYNGKIGQITDIEEETITVKCPGDAHSIKVGELEWENIKYALDEKTKEIKETVAGSFKQIPLKLAWAITIHKSQGLTFEKAIIDAQAAFAHGQVYVALSRCKSLEGLVLSSQIASSSVKSDPGIKQFNQNVEANQPDRNDLEASRKKYQENLLCELFTFDAIQKEMYFFIKGLNENASALVKDNASEIKTANENFKTQIASVAPKFINQIRFLLLEEGNAEKNVTLQERLKKASVFFSQKLEESLLNPIAKINLETDNKQVKKALTDNANKLYQEICFKNTCLKLIGNGFVLKDFLAQKAKAAIEKSATIKHSKPVSEESTSLAHGDLYNLLKSWRNAKAEEMDVETYMIVPVKTLREIADKIPSSRKSLLAVKGFGKRKLEQFGTELIEILNDYRIDKQLEILPDEEPVEKKKQPKTNSKAESLKLFKEGKTIEEIASERQLVRGTIESHLSAYIKTGELRIEELMPKEKIEKIIAAFTSKGTVSITAAKEKLGKNYSYTELRFVLNHLIFTEMNN